MADLNPNDAVERLAALERRAANLASSDMARSLSRQRFLARIDTDLETRPRFQMLRWALPAAAAVCLAAAFLLFWWPPSLTFQVAGAELSGKYVSAPAAHTAELRFSDESTLVASAGSRLRVEETTSHGARVLLERGKTNVHVVHRTSTAWTFGAGPFEVHVTGTRFDLAWDPVQELCELRMYEGSVEVRGRGGSGPLVVHAGQRFRGDASSMQVVDLSAMNVPAPIPSAVNAVPEPSATVSELPSAAAPEPKPHTAEAAKPSWSDRITQGKFAEIVSEAEERGIPHCLSACGAADLRALADAARYTGNTALAERSLTSIRQRFPGAQRSEAAFQLGRLQEKRGQSGAALTWYETYLREAPSGAFAAEALAGKLRAVKATQGKQAAEPIAREYLRRFPQGVHVGTAREILGEK